MASTTRYQAVRYRRRTSPYVLLSTADRHLVSRFSYGIDPTLAQAVRRAGGGAAWFERQLSPGSVADAPAAALDAWWPSLRRTPLDLWQRNTTEVEAGWEVMADYGRWLMMRQMTSTRQVHEVMTEFWTNHLHVPINGDGWFTWRKAYGDVIRKHALGRFDRMLVAAATHPAMLIYLDQAVSTKRRPNENLARELLELHTVGLVYSEDDVKASARILTGWKVDTWKTWAASYVPGDHATGPVQVLGFSDANADADGRDLTHRYLTYLAHHPATAERLARKLAVRFVSDTPSAALVARLAKIYLDSDTDIRPVLRHLVRTTEFKESIGAKVRGPVEDVVATCRVLRARIGRPTQDSSAARALLWQAQTLGGTPHSWPRPDGAPLDNQAWSSPSRALASFSLHYTMAGGWWPRDQITWRTPAQWLPQRSLRFDQLVDHLSQQLLHRYSTAGLLQACCQATGCTPAEVITADHGLVRWGMPRLLATFLDSPAHFAR